MFNNNKGITVKKGAAPVQILASTDMQYSVGVVVNQSAATKGVAKAGTPLTGDLTARGTAFTKAINGATSNAVGVLLHDVDLSKGNNNGTLLLFGAVDLSKLDSETAAYIDEHVKAALPTVKFIK